MIEILALTKEWSIIFIYSVYRSLWIDTFRSFLMIKARIMAFDIIKAIKDSRTMITS